MTRRTLIRLAVLSVLVPGMIWAKRLPAPEVKPVVDHGIRYIAPNLDGTRGVVEAWDVAAQKKLWEVVVFRITVKPGLEADVQWVYVKSLELRQGKLIVRTERNVTYGVDLSTRKVERVKS